MGGRGRAETRIQRFLHGFSYSNQDEQERLVLVVKVEVEVIN